MIYFRAPKANNLKKMKKILLVMSPMFKHDTHLLASTDNEIPIGLCYLGAVLEKAGHSVKIFDGQLTQNTKQELLKLVKEENFDVVGFSTVSPAASSTSQLARLVKEIRPNTLTIIGGVHPTVTGIGTLGQMPAIDIAVFGEGEITILELAEFLEGKRRLADIDGIGFRSNGKNIRTKPRRLIENLDSLPFPAYHLVDIYKYTPPPGLFFRKSIVSMISARGCPYNCNFCADTLLGEGRCRLRKAQAVVDEMEFLAKNMGVREIKFTDDTFTINRERVIEICNEFLKRKLDLLWRCASRVNTVDEELLKLMKKSGCSSISFGIESGSDEILKKMNKKISIEQVRNAVKWAKKAGMETKGFFMLNYPGETIETTEKTIALSKELDLDFAGFNLTVPYKGTQVREEIKKNYRVETKYWDSPDTAIGNQIYFYQDNLPVEYLKKAYQRAIYGFYLRPRWVLKALKSISNPLLFKSYIIGFFRLFKIHIIG